MDSTEVIASQENISYSELDMIVIALMDTYYPFSPVIYSGIVVTMFAIGLCANAVLLLYLIWSGKNKSPVFAILTSLSVCDTGTCFALILTEKLLYAEVTTSHPDVTCKIIMYLVCTTYCSSLLHLMSLASIRFWQLIYPLSAMVTLSTGRVVKLCYLLWALAFTITSPLAVYTGTYSVYHRGRIRNFCLFHGNNQLKDILLNVFWITIPPLFIAFVHVVKQCILSRRRRISKDVIKDRGRSTSARTVTLIIVMFYISSSPVFVHDAYHDYLGFPEASFHFIVYNTTWAVAFSNSIWNPFLYLFSSRDIRTEVKAMIISFASCKRDS